MKTIERVARLIEEYEALSKSEKEVFDVSVRMRAPKSPVRFGRLYFEAGALIRRGIRTYLRRMECSHGITWNEDKGLLSSDFEVRGEESVLRWMNTRLKTLE